MQTGILRYEQNSIHVSRFGQGERLLFAFHDLGQDASSFLPMERALGHRYSIIALELPGLGLSEWTTKHIDKLALVTIVERFKLEFKVDRFDMVAKGLGALYALSLMEQRSEWIGKVVLFAPEGLRRSSWQHLATMHLWAKRKIQGAAYDPSLKDRKLRTLLGWGLLKKEWMPAVEQYISDENYRDLWNKAFPLHFKLVPEIQKVRWNVKKNGLEVHIFCAEDQFTMKKDAFKFAKKQDHTFVTFLPPDDLNKVELLLDKAGDILNPTR